MRKLLLVVLASSLAFQLPVSAQTPAPGGTQADLATGIGQVEEGDLEAAAITLDGVVQRLKQEKGREKDLATAHLYLAMTHLGLSQWERAKGEMREAWRNNQQLTLDPKKFPPRVIQLYEQTKQEGQQAEVAPSPRPVAAASPQPAPKPTPAASPVPPKTAQAAPAKKGGSKALWIGLGVAAAGGGIALAAGGGGGSGSSPSPPTGSAPSPAPTPLSSSFTPGAAQGPGTITLLSASPTPGSTISVGSCPSCPNMAFSVVPTADYNPQAFVRLIFQQGSTFCFVLFGSLSPLRAGVGQTVTVSAANSSSSLLTCSETTTMTFRVEDSSTNALVFSQQYAGGYRFIP